MSCSDLPGHKCSHRYSSGGELTPQKAAVTGSRPVLCRTSQCSITSGFKNNWPRSSWFLVTFLQLKPWNRQKQLCILLKTNERCCPSPIINITFLALLLFGYLLCLGLCPAWLGSCCCGAIQELYAWASGVKRHCSAKAKQIHLSNVSNICYVILYSQWQKTWHKRQKSW